jgi:hypothetical protein
VIKKPQYSGGQGSKMGCSTTEKFYAVNVIFFVKISRWRPHLVLEEWQRSIKTREKGKKKTEQRKLVLQEAELCPHIHHHRNCPTWVLSHTWMLAAAGNRVPITSKHKHILKSIPPLSPHFRISIPK